MREHPFKVFLGEGHIQVTEAPVGYSLFSGGEVNLKIPHNLLYGNAEQVYIQCSLQNSNDIMALCMLVDALKQHNPHGRYALMLGYTPYARQDRVCNVGEALSIKVFANIINSLGFSKVVLTDPHSDVTGAVINNVTGIIGQAEILENSPLGDPLGCGYYTLVSPDSGATKKTEDISKAFGGVPVVQGHKHRDLKTGKLSGFGVSDPNGLLKGADCLIVDDICDGGGTFLGLAKELRKAGAQTITLFVTHGIFSQGVEKLLDNGINWIYTTDSFISGEEHERLTYVEI